MKQIIKIALLSFTLPCLLLADMDRCVSCHGVDFEKKALGVSKIVQDMSQKQIKDALDGYKNGTYGGSMKELMTQEVNLGVDTDAMSADIYHESREVGFNEPSDEFIFQKRLSVRTLHKLKKSIKEANPKKDMPKIYGQITSAAFTMYTYDTLLQEQVGFANYVLIKEKLNKKNILKTVRKVKTCVDHSFSKEDIVKCRVDFFNLAISLTKNKEKKIKKKQKANKPVIYTGQDAVNIDKYIKR